MGGDGGAGGLEKKEDDVFEEGWYPNADYDKW